LQLGLGGDPLRLQFLGCLPLAPSARSFCSGELAEASAVSASNDKAREVASAVKDHPFTFHRNGKGDVGKCRTCEMRHRSRPFVVCCCTCANAEALSVHNWEEVTATKIHSAFVSPRPGGRKISTLVIANQYEIIGAGLEALLQASGHSVVGCCSREDDLLRSAEAYHPDIIILAENIVRQDTAETVLRLRAHNYSVAIIFLLTTATRPRPRIWWTLTWRGYC
jgi:hypothetical protein